MASVNPAGTTSQCLCKFVTRQPTSKSYESDVYNFQIFPAFFCARKELGTAF
jgi:hypothetical protein